MRGCLREDELSAWLEHRLPTGAWAEAEAHVDGCPECRQLLSMLARVEGTDAPDGEGSEPLTSLVQALAPRYQLGAELGHGGMGVVYAARDTVLGRTVALKVLHQGRTEGLLLQEAQVLARMAHPNVITVHDAGTAGGRVYLAMERVEGMTLRQWMRERPRAWSEVLPVLLQAGQGLLAAHAEGLVHRDFKPDNVLLGPGARVRVTDFGLARDVVQEGEGRPGGAPQAALLGTPVYMPPEQLRGETVDARADQFSFAVSLYETLAGARPFIGITPAQLLESISAQRPPPLPRAVPPFLRRVLARALRADPGQRFASMSDLMAALSRGARARRLAPAVAVGVTCSLACLAWLTYRVWPRPCTAPRNEVVARWGPGAHASVRDALRATGVLYAERAWDETQRTLDAYAEHWAEGQTEACERARAGHVAFQPSPCAERGWLRFGALVGTLAGADAVVTQNALVAARELPALDACAPGAAVTAPEELWRQLANVHALLDVGRNRAAFAAAKVLTASLVQPAEVALRADALTLQGTAQSRVKELGSPLLSLAQAVELAQKAGDLALETEARTAQLAALNRAPEPTTATKAAVQLQGLWTRTTVPPYVLAAGLREVARSLAVEGKDPLALLEASKQSVAADEVATLALDAERLEVLRKGDPGRARVFAQSLLSRQAKLFGAEHPFTLQTREQLALLDAQVGNLAAARQELEDVATALARDPGVSSRRVAAVRAELEKVTNDVSRRPSPW